MENLHNVHGVHGVNTNTAAANQSKFLRHRFSGAPSLPVVCTSQMVAHRRWSDWWRTEGCHGLLQNKTILPISDGLNLKKMGGDIVSDAYLISLRFAMRHVLPGRLHENVMFRSGFHGLSRSGMDPNVLRIYGRVLFSLQEAAEARHPGLVSVRARFPFFLFFCWPGIFRACPCVLKRTDFQQVLDDILNIFSLYPSQPHKGSDIRDLVNFVTDTLASRSFRRDDFFNLYLANEVLKFTRALDFSVLKKFVLMRPLCMQALLSYHEQTARRCAEYLQVVRQVLAEVSLNRDIVEFVILPFIDLSSLCVRLV